MREVFQSSHSRVAQKESARCLTEGKWIISEVAGEAALTNGEAAVH